MTPFRPTHPDHTGTGSEQAARKNTRPPTTFRRQTRRRANDSVINNLVQSTLARNSDELQ